MAAIDKAVAEWRKQHPGYYDNHDYAWSFIKRSAYHDIIHRLIPGVSWLTLQHMTKIHKTLRWHVVDTLRKSMPENDHWKLNGYVLSSDEYPTWDEAKAAYDALTTVSPMPDDDEEELDAGLLDHNNKYE